tara:strand:- start:458496 stop:460412 length:1917 start_codon:yes stop_codon:yes gene_type:complete
VNQTGRNIFLWIFIIFGALMIYNAVDKQQAAQDEVSYTTFMQMVNNSEVREVEIEGDMLTGTSANGSAVTARAPRDGDLVKNLREQGVNIQVKEDTRGRPSLMSILLGWFPFLLLIGVWVFFMRQQMGSGKGGAFSFGKSRAQMLTEHQIKVTFDDVAGVEEAKEELREVVDFLKDPSKFSRLGGKIPKGALLVGSPGTGKTLLARAVAGEAGVPFFSISGSDFVEMFVGVGAARVRDLFEQGKRNAPCIIFIDEIDAVGRHRGAGHGGGNDEREQTLNQLLVEMDGFEANEGVILIAATNRPDVLDPALLRPGRFDRQVIVPLPDIQGRTRILEVHMQRVPLGADVDASVIARGTPGFSGADLANLVNEAALMAARHDKRLVDMADFEAAKDKVMMGAERRSSVMTQEQKKTTAYHEAGHAIVALKLDGPCDPVHKVTIIPRGRALGVTMQLPEEDKYTHDKKYLENQIAILMGGRLAEELILDQMTTGASNDIERASDIARRMVTSWGMSAKMGPQNYGQEEGQPFLGRGGGMSSGVMLSEETAKQIDAEVRSFIDTNYKRAKKVLKDNEDLLHKMSELLLEVETIDAQQIKELVDGKTVTRKKPSRKATAAKKAKTSEKSTAKKKTTKTSPKAKK